MNSVIEIEIVYREDRKAIKVLGGMSAMLRFTVAEWQSKGRGRYQKWLPKSWRVPVRELAGIVPIKREEADVIAERRSEAGKKAAETASTRAREYRRQVMIEEGVSAHPDSLTAYALASGEISSWRAKLIAFKCEYRHEHTDYETLLLKGIERDCARECADCIHSPASWEDYLETYGFHGPIAEALAGVLRSHKEAHPVWFYEACLAIEYTGADLSGLTYEKIREAIEEFRSETW